MNIKSNLLFFTSTFPVFIIRSNFTLFEILNILIFYFVLLIINYFLLKHLENKSNIKNKIYLSLVVTYGLDNHLGLFSGLIQPNINYVFEFFTIIYIPALIVFILLLLIIFFMIYKLNNENTLKISLVALITLALFNLFDDTKHHKHIHYFEKNVQKKFDRSTIVLVFDEMSGMSSLSSENPEGKVVNNNFIKLFQKYNFDYYPDILSISRFTTVSLSSLINFNTDPKKVIKSNLWVPSKNYFTEYDINQNKFFDKYESISVIQNMHLNFCNNSSVKSCYQYNPFNLDIINAKVNFFSKFISNWNLNGSIIAKFIWRSFKHLSVINSTLEPEGEKKFINEITNYTLKKINSKKYDLIFLHVLVPHLPYGFNENCEYKNKISNLNIYLSISDKIKQHNIERNCVIKILDKFLEKINKIENHKIFVLSDHGSRITNEKKSSLSTIFAFKNFNSKTSDVINKNNMQKEFKFLNNE